jgi:hypothetical protein
MGQIHGYNLGSPTANVTSNGELVVTGSIILSNSTDETTQCVKTIDFEHHEIHEGDHFSVTGFESVNSGASVNFVTQTPNTTKWTHMTFDVQGTSQTEIRVYEGATWSGGTSSSPINNNRNSATTSTLTVSYKPTVTASGTLIYSQSRGLKGATPAVADNVGNIVRTHELILKSGTSYLWAIKSADDSNVISYQGHWYEHTND